ncbi:shikimate dehydrogenase [Reichenbachiella sp. MALMAid0571]|uniref:shikimate dehydrogenase family protein n=1 Tax=Reichenbachiella sp. MALMAid0571 TaxID=3143939 RepID=UPI0032DF8A1E
MRKFGLIGKTLKHSFSGKYFGEKFEKENIDDCTYELFELPDISEFPKLITSHKGALKGLNVTIPYKKEVMFFLDELDSIAERIGAVNVVKINSNGSLKGFNSDYYGFRSSLENWLSHTNLKALILGTGGASNAVRTALEDLKIPFQHVSRNEDENRITYNDIKQNPQILKDHKLIINTTPLGTFPDVDQKPDLPYSQLTEEHYLYDLVYNPEVTAFLAEGKSAGAKTKNGSDMLILQAEKSWEIWNG